MIAGLTDTAISRRNEAATKRRRNQKQVVDEPVRSAHPPEPPMRVLHRFIGAGGHWAEIRSRNMNQLNALELACL